MTRANPDRLNDHAGIAEAGRTLNLPKGASTEVARPRLSGKKPHVIDGQTSLDDFLGAPHDDADPAAGDRVEG